MRKYSNEMKIEGRVSQGEVDSSKASINDLIRHRQTLTDSRKTKMTSIVKKRGGQGDDWLMLMSDLIKRDTDAKNGMMEFVA